MATRVRPSVFVGSSGKGGHLVAQSVQSLLDKVCEVEIWSQGVFGLTHGTLESLVLALDRFDFAVLILTPDDLIATRDADRQVPRDNVIFELGLFVGSLGRDRTFMVYNRETPLSLPSDLAGIAAATFQTHATGNLDAALGAACTRIQKSIARLGILDKSGRQLAQVERDVRDQETRLSKQQAVINQLVIFSMSQPVYEKLHHIYNCKNAKSGEYIYTLEHEEDTRREFLFLRDHGYIASTRGSYFSPGMDLVGKDVVPLLELTPIGVFYVEQREALRRRLRE